MKNNIKVNLGCWLAAQFKTVLAKKNKSLILGSYITHLVVQLGVLNLQDHNLHLAFEMKFLNTECLERMGVLEYVDGFYRFTPPRPPHVPPRSSFVRSSPAGDDPGPSTSVLPPLPLGVDDWHQLRTQVQNLEARVINIDANVASMAQNLAAFMHHAGLAPQFPPNPSL